jgi:hypothetical protein
MSEYKYPGLLSPPPLAARLFESTPTEQAVFPDNLESKIDAITKAILNPPSIIEQNNALRILNDKLFNELIKESLEKAQLEYELKPKKRGRKPKPKGEINNAPKIIGRPKEMDDELLIKTIESLKDDHGFNDKSACFELSIFHVEKNGLAGWRAKSEARKLQSKLQTRLSKARKKIRAKKAMPNN